MRVFIVIIFLVMTKFWCRPRHIFIFLQICGCVLWPVLFLISELRCVIDQLLFLVDFSNVSQQGFTLFQCSVVALGVFMSSQISEKPSQVFFFSLLGFHSIFFKFGCLCPMAECIIFIISSLILLLRVCWCRALHQQTLQYRIL